MDFDFWMALVNKCLEEEVGLTSDDLPDVAYRAMYDRGVKASSAANKAIAFAKEEFGV